MTKKDLLEECCASLFPNLKPGKPSQIVDWPTAQDGEAVFKNYLADFLKGSLISFSF